MQLNAEHIVIVTIILVVVIFGFSKTSKDESVDLEQNVDKVSSKYIEESNSEREEVSNSENVEDDTNSNIQEMEEQVSLEETEFSYFLGREYDEVSIPKRFGYVVEEHIIDREVPLDEESFTKLKKGQYFSLIWAVGLESADPGIIEVIGQCDGEIMYTTRSPGTGMARTSPYYKIDDNTYIVLFFEDQRAQLPLDYIEV